VPPTFHPPSAHLPPTFHPPSAHLPPTSIVAVMLTASPHAGPASSQRRRPGADVSSHVVAKPPGCMVALRVGSCALGKGTVGAFGSS
jgi:hypothetical protein